jgi:hypothetical protein
VIDTNVIDTAATWNEPRSHEPGPDELESE